MAKKLITFFWAKSINHSARYLTEFNCACSFLLVIRKEFGRAGDDFSETL
jgi:hypothetical protein